MGTNMKNLNPNNRARVRSVILLVILSGMSGILNAASRLTAGEVDAIIVEKNEIIKIGGYLDGISSPTPEPPNLYGSSDGFDGVVSSVRQLYHIQHYNNISKSLGSGIFVNRVDEYSDDNSAKAALQENVKSLVGRLNNPTVDHGGPIFGDETIYVNGNFGTESYVANAAFFRVGRLISYIRINTREQLPVRGEQPYPLGKYIAPVTKRMTSALTGKLKAAVVSPSITKLLPPFSAYQNIGSFVGPVTITPESWATVEVSGTEQEITQLLTSGGANKIGYFSIQLGAAPKMIITGAIFPLRSQNYSDKWYMQTTTGMENNVSPLPQSIRSVFFKDSGYYQLIFQKGKTVVTLDCYGQNSVEEALCENSLRSLSTTWFDSLP